ncbi:MAG: T9SS type A sorting domain-containing protein [Bacteroidales bacterium]|nr:T9SS type A sorting domain-containing protein [Bacteroidales bacterium]
MEMIKRKIFSVSGLIIGLLILSQVANAQLDGSGIAPDFKLTDVKGADHQLYDYLDQGKVVILDFFAVWCSICQADAPYLGEVYDELGPEGTKQIEMLSLEADDATSDNQTINYALNFQSANPHINSTNQVPADYNVNFFPTYYVIAPDRSYTLILGRQGNMKTQMIEAIESAPTLRSVENDIRVMSYSKPKESICRNSFSPELRIQNYGKNDISALTIETWIDEQLVSSFPYAYLLKPYQYSDLSLPEISGLSSGWHKIDFKFVDVNGQEDGDPSNSLGGDFLMLHDGVQISVELTTDAYPKETSWKILEEGKMVAEGDAYTKGLTLDITDVCVEEKACYRLVIYDKYGDGISSGGIVVRFLDEIIGEIQASEFNADSSWVDFCVVPGSSGIDQHEKAELSFRVYPNPSNGKFKLILAGMAIPDGEVTVIDITGRQLFSTSLQRGQKILTIDLSDSDVGIYFVRLKTNNSLQTQRIIVDR